MVVFPLDPHVVQFVIEQLVLAKTLLLLLELAVVPHAKLVSGQIVLLHGTPRAIEYAAQLEST
jgi:hypothetical protein